MLEVKPWMRRATREAEDNCKHGSDWACGPCYIKSLAAHAPPVDGLVDALRHMEWCGQCGEDSWGACSEGQKAIEALALYDSWLAKQEEK